MQAAVCGDVVDAGAELFARSGVHVGVRAFAAIQGCMILADDVVGVSAYGKRVEVVEVLHYLVEQLYCRSFYTYYII